MADNFGLKIGLEGEKEFKKALSEINQSFKVLGSEMKLATSQFDKNDQSVQALTARNTVLNKEIEAQKQKIETLRAALKNAAESFGENDRRTQNWQIQLNNAEAALNGMERELKDNNEALEQAENGFDEAGKEAEDFGKEIDKAGDESEDAGGKLKKVGEIAADVGKAMAAAVVAIGTAAVAAGKKLWDMSNDVAAFGDNIDKTSQKIGISAESYQEWDYVFQRCGSDVNNLQTGMKKLSGVITDAASGSDSAAEKLSAVGLSIEDLNGKSQDEQLSIVISALQKMESGAERTAAANDLLGKSAVDMAAVLNMSAEETEALKQEAQDYGMVMSNEAVAASAAFEDSLTRLQGAMGGLKNRMVGELLPGITLIMDGLSDLVAGNEEAGEKLKSGVVSVVETVTEMIPQVVELITMIATAVLECAPAIISALAEGIINAIPTLLPVVLQVIQELVAALLELLPQLIEAGVQVIASLVTGIANALPTLIPAAVQAIVTVVQGLVDPTTVRKVLTNEKYCGDLLLQKVYRENHLTKKMRPNTGELPQYFVEDDHPAVVSRETFAAVQKELERRAEEKAPTVGTTSVFTGKIRCSCCGKNYRRKTTPYNIVWCCSTYNSKGKKYCPDSKVIPEETLKRAVTDILKTDGFSDEAFQMQVCTIEAHPGNLLRFIFIDGSTTDYVWKDRSRSESWTDEMKAAAAKKAKERYASHDK